ncbi:MAG: CBS domain-containing protein [Tannerella sp.]|nr:CBS domain-containing protein [Tannerella sp.]
MESDDYFPNTLLQVIQYANINDFAAAIGVALILLSFATLMAAAENAVSHLPQDDMSAVEESQSAKDKAISYLYYHLRLMKASCSIVYAVIIIYMTTFCVYGISSVNPEPFAITYPAAVVAAIILWWLFYGIFPKIFLKHKLRTARALAPLLKTVIKLCSPFVKMTNTNVESYEADSHRKNPVPLPHEAPNDFYEEKEMLDGIVRFYNKKANEIMTPRTDIEAIDIKSDINEVIKVIKESGFSRFPVYEGNEDNIKGILVVKGIITALNNSGDFEWQTLIRKPFYVPESKKIYDLLNELRAKKTHIAIVVDEFGCTSGIITMEDIIEEIIGDISDEYDEDKESFLALSDGSFILEGKLQLIDFFRETGVPTSDFSGLTDEAETLTGLLLAIKGSLPLRREDINYKNYRFHILEADERRILKVKFIINPKEDHD